MSDSQIDNVASTQELLVEYADSSFNGVIIHSLTHVSNSTIHAGQTKVLAGVSVFMYIMATMHLAVKWFYVREAFIRYGLESGETRLLSLTVWLIIGPLWVRVISSLAVGTNIFIADGIIIWRCWIIWERNWRIVILPCIFIAAFCLEQFLTLPTDLEGKRYYMNWRMLYFIMALPTTIICTTLIVYRLARANRTGNSLNFRTNLYYQVIEIVVESSMLYVVALVVSIPFFATNDPYSAYPQAVLDSVTGIAPTLILLRVVSMLPDQAKVFATPVKIRSVTCGNDVMMLIGLDKRGEVVRAACVMLAYREM
ncbi:hypothetical protein ARMSODRAFT_981822 [Armillaria solidipes]|uniref:Uncharacterized protein n=1 Tax=Armillaria solidipes TaxID=1076256 RepID=A0A2H3BB87_9AGAR|nr:hypothetical protein ARMSODRAFT_981822 [Armillaria solidipes]